MAILASITSTFSQWEKVPSGREADEGLQFYRLAPS